MAAMSLTIVDHPLAQHILTELRAVETEPAAFRRLAHTLSTILILAATTDLQTETVGVQTPLEHTHSPRLTQGLAVVPVLRAGLSMLESALALFPDVAVGYIGLERQHATAIANSYYSKLPSLEGRTVLCVDPMLATGGSASQALSLLKACGGSDVRLVSVIAAPQGVQRIAEDHPDVKVFVTVVDRCLNVDKYILPGLGDYGDRLYGT